MISFRKFSIETDRGVGIAVSLNPASPHVDVLKDGRVVDTLRGQEKVAATCRSSLLDILELLETVAEEVGATQAPVPVVPVASAEVIPITRAGRFESIEF